ncbi:transglutaminase [Haloferax gibbonsii ATCC 33959]|uniref:Transglutaminase n=1 Tax=Haloferax gibbonsii (strain ATCC 33959 / DSM 4427 / JCM 8863 / NBRC 102184 / NCIMB 2188 / Ma 2.38) TaxID=1227459 RepID=M0H3Y1_HALGM|nr:transglutaminase domain-containing protein [Haloferax gibbonsii]ELZ79226.1 transglutaminase [Haloferax gibbonsii ATCC 33959]
MSTDTNRRGSDSSRSAASASASATGSASSATNTVFGVPADLLATAASLVLIGAFLAVVYDITNVVGRRDQFVLLAAGTLALATVVGWTLRPRYALGLAALIAAGGFAAYFLALPESQVALLSPERLLADTFALLSGLSALRLLSADVWALAVTPGPVFLAWYLAVRGRIAPAVAVAGSGLGLFVLTTDATGTLTLLGVGAGMAAVGFDGIDRFGSAGGQLDVLTVVLAAMVVLSATVTVLPGAGGSPVIPDEGVAEQPTVEASLVSADDRISIVGSISLSPQVRFEVQSTSPDYWQTATFDRYTGDGWVRTGDTRDYEGGRLAGPEGPSRLVRQTVTPATPLDSMPAAWRPVAVSGDIENETLVTQQGNLRPDRAVEIGETYNVTSAVPQYTAASLRRTGTDYPDEIRERYLALPDSTSDRVRDRAAEITGDAETPYDKAVAVEEWLEANKEYSLRVSRPDGDIAESFLFEMDAGYCTYYASTMVVLLRSEGVPARFVTGYTTGERVDGDRYVVRGLDSHAWVEVYFEDTGWVRFDPTPAGPRQDAESTTLSDARNEGRLGVDTNETNAESNETEQPTTTANDTETPTENGTETNSTPVDSSAPGPNIDERLGITPTGDGATEDDEDDGLVPEMPSRETIFVGLVGLLGVVAGVRRTRLPAHLRFATAAYQRRTDSPADDVFRAYDRLELALERDYRPRRPGETVRAYLDSLSRVGVDERTRQVGRLYERAKYGDGVTRADADEAVAAANAVVRARLPLVRRWAD